MTWQNQLCKPLTFLSRPWILKKTTLDISGKLRSHSRKHGIPQFLSEEELEQWQESLHLASHEVRTVNNVKLTALVQFHHHLKNDPPNMSPSASKSFFHVWGQVPAKEAFSLKLSKLTEISIIIIVMIHFQAIQLVISLGDDA